MFTKILLLSSLANKNRVNARCGRYLTGAGHAFKCMAHEFLVMAKPRDQQTCEGHHPARWNSWTTQPCPLPSTSHSRLALPANTYSRRKTATLYN